MQQCLSLLAPTVEITRPAILFNLRDMPPNGSPPADLALVIRAASPQAVAAVPLEPTSRVLRVNPIFRTPNGKRLRRIDTIEIQFGIMAFWAEFGIFKPIGRILRSAIGHVFAAENAKLKHFLWRKLGTKVRMEILAHGLCQQVNITLLHQVINFDRLVVILHRIAHCSFKSQLLSRRANCAFPEGETAEILLKNVHICQLRAIRNRIQNNKNTPERIFIFLINSSWSSLRPSAMNTK